MKNDLIIFENYKVRRLYDETTETWYFSVDGKKYLTDVANAATVLRLIQSIPSPKAEPIKVWL
jgi:hypothetical protein